MGLSWSQLGSIALLFTVTACCELGSRSPENMALADGLQTRPATALADRPDSAVGVLQAWTQVDLPGAVNLESCVAFAERLPANLRTGEGAGERVSGLYAEDLAASKMWPAMEACDAMFRFRCTFRESRNSAEFTLATEAAEFVSMSKLLVRWMESKRLPIGDATSVLAYMRLVQSRAAEKAVAEPDSAWSDFAALDALPRLALTPTPWLPLHASVLLPEDYLGVLPSGESDYVSNLQGTLSYASLDLEEASITTGGGFSDLNAVLISPEQFRALHFVPMAITRLESGAIGVAGVDPRFAKGVLLEIFAKIGSDQYESLTRIEASHRFTSVSAIGKPRTKHKIVVLDPFNGLVELIDTRTWESEVLVDSRVPGWVEHARNVSYILLKKTEHSPSRWVIDVVRWSDNSLASLLLSGVLLRILDQDKDGTFESMQRISLDAKWLPPEEMQK